MHRMKRIHLVVTLCVGAMLATLALAACGGDDAASPADAPPSPTAEPSEPPAPEPTAEPPAAEPPADAPFSLAEAAAPYAGTTLTILEEHNGDLENFFDLYSQFEEETGINLELSIEAHPDVLTKGETDLYTGAGRYDVVLIHAFQGPGLVSQQTIEPIDDYYGNPALRDPSVSFEAFLQPAGDAISQWGTQNYCFNRWNYTNIWWGLKNLFEHADEQAAFTEAYGYALAPPETLQQVRDIAEFFTRDAGKTLAGETLERPYYGIVMEGSPLGLVGNEFWFNWLNQFGGSLFDAEGQPTANLPENVAALEFYASLWEFAPPGQAEFTFFDIPVLAGEGVAAQGFGQTEVFIAIDAPGGSKNAGNFIYNGIPFNEASPETRSGQAVPTCDVINAASENKEAAYLFLQWMSSQSTENAWIDLGGPFLPVLQESLNNPRVQERPSYFEAFAESQANVQQYPPVGNFLELLTHLNLRVQEAALGNTSPQAALDALQDDLIGICPEGSCYVDLP